MGFVALSLGPLTLFATMFVYRLPFLHSISESATIANQVSPLLPYCLGALALFSLTYAIMHRYNDLDAMLTGCMFAGFTAVAMQMCRSPYITEDKVGLLGLSERVSNMVHDAGAIIGFGSMILWILMCFKQSDVPAAKRTREKRLRNNAYTALGMAMLASLLLFLLKDEGLFAPDFPMLFIVECLMLTFGGLACLLKGGFMLKDKNE